MCHVAFLQETNTLVVASLPQDQPCWFDGLEDTQRHDAAFLVHRDIAASCAQIPGHWDRRVLFAKSVREKKKFRASEVIPIFAGDC